MSRRQWLAAGATLAGYALAAAPSLAQAVRTDEAGPATSRSEITVGDVAMPVYEARPAAAAKVPIVVLLSEIWGVHEYIRDCARRFAKAGSVRWPPSCLREDMKRFVDLAKAGNPNVEMVVYPDAGHAFHADYRPSYQPAAAAAAWEKCLQFFARHLRA